jgi:hypothetical protein
MHTKFSSGNPKGRDRIKNLSVDEWMILKWILEKHGVKERSTLDLLKTESYMTFVTTVMRLYFP